MNIGDRIAELLAAGDTGELVAFLDKLHAADVAEALEGMGDGPRARVFALLGDERAALVLQEMEPDDQVALLRQVDAGRAARIVQEMSSDDLADLLGEVRPDEAKDILGLMPADEAADMQELLEYSEDTAGGLMTTEFIALREGLTAEQAIVTLRELAPDAETIYYVYVVDRENRLVGVISLRDLIIASPDRPLGVIAKGDVIAVTADTDQEQVARLVARYDLLALPVVDAEQRLLGIVTVDDVVDVIEEEATEDVVRFAATAAEADVELGAWQRARRRLPWLVALLFGGLLAGSVIKGFSHTLEAVTLLAVFIPVMAGEAGNAGTQSLAVVVRGIATGNVDTRRIWRVVLGEARVGALVGAAIGLLLAVTASLWHGQPALGALVGVVLGLNMTLASALGGFFPVVIHRLGLDPAVASGPFITTLTDVFSMLIYFGLATVFISFLR